MTANLPAAPVEQAEQDPTRRLVLLGASNISRGFATLLTTAAQAHRGPLDILAAEGRGRSYGIESSVMGRRLSGILSCGLWSAWAERPPLPTSALVADVGNDLAYGVSVEQTLAWVEECLRRLRDRCDELVMTSVPVERLRRVKSWQFLVLRTLLFPQNRAVWADLLPQVEALDGGLRELAGRYGATVVEPRTEWYGFDPIHLRYTHWGAAWREIVAAWRSAAPGEQVRTDAASWLRSQLWRPAERRLFGFVQRCAQPCVVLPDGTRVSLY